MIIPDTARAQDFTFTSQRQKQALKFKLIKNLVIIPLYINNKGPYDFVLDTGVAPMIITDSSIIDSLNFNKLRKIKVTGLGTQDVDAYISQSLNVRVGRATLNNIAAAVLKEDLFNLSGHLGLKICGLIGYSFFNSFVVDINYSSATIKFYAPYEKIKYKGTKVPITIENSKPYVTADLELADGQKINTAKFLMDTGASHAISLETFNGNAFPLPSYKINSILGMSLSGQIKGYLGRISKINLSTYSFKDVVSSFPDYKLIEQKIDNGRNGNIGAEILKRFNIQFNYKEGFMYIKPSIYYKRSFEHDRVGMVVFVDQKTFKRVIIGAVDIDSPAYKADLHIDDEILAVNFFSIEHYSLDDLDNLFKSTKNKTLIFEIYRDNQHLYKVVHLQKRL